MGNFFVQNVEPFTWIPHQHEMKPLEAWVDVARKRVDQIEVDGDLPKLQKIIAEVNVSRPSTCVVLTDSPPLPALSYNKR